MSYSAQQYRSSLRVYSATQKLYARHGDTMVAFREKVFDSVDLPDKAALLSPTTLTIRQLLVLLRGKYEVTPRGRKEEAFEMYERVNLDHQRVGGEHVRTWMLEWLACAKKVVEEGVVPVLAVKRDFLYHAACLDEAFYESFAPRVLSDGVSIDEMVRIFNQWMGM